jgi:hypothetical protein
VEYLLEVECLLEVERLLKVECLLEVERLLKVECLLELDKQEVVGLAKVSDSTVVVLQKAVFPVQSRLVGRSENTTENWKVTSLTKHILDGGRFGQHSRRPLAPRYGRDTWPLVRHYLRRCWRRWRRCP